MLPSVASVRFDGVEVLDENHHVRDLAGKLGILSYTLRDDAPDAFSYALVLDGRADFDITLAECVDGQQRMKVEFTYPSDVQGEITYEAIPSSGDITNPNILESGPALDELIDCDQDYSIVATRFSGRNIVSVKGEAIFRQ